MNNKPKRPNRVKIVGIDEQLLIDVFNWWRNPPSWLGLPITDELPENCEVLRVYVNYEMRCIDLLVYHPSFPACEPGNIPERVPDCLRQMRSVPFGAVAELTEVQK